MRAHAVPRAPLDPKGLDITRRVHHDVPQLNATASIATIRKTSHWAPATR